MIIFVAPVLTGYWAANGASPASRGKPPRRGGAGGEQPLPGSTRCRLACAAWLGCQRLPVGDFPGFAAGRSWPTTSERGRGSSLRRDSGSASNQVLGPMLFPWMGLGPMLGITAGVTVAYQARTPQHIRACSYNKDTHTPPPPERPSCERNKMKCRLYIIDGVLLSTGSCRKTLGQTPVSAIYA